ncbi:2-phosphosulfolactate phosphatase [Deinococcus proteolyticus MRP]|uniref:Probable 2-phosphosulfolactate phosphatase n=1 Tax=Deinococcus proteolyticus (strain ATCC 35074 / DSM 20540 / JCM 6276 / NBRC 101906 / NCIMB 13154 / VKM Ac-1939 / CCM 2703 / MRP) TaxID=693977 RepID=F0RMS9_DEIPM|nr:2-phosphosulfolactate phosphatase [Deinococcus proteolyticus]ADY27147.1 2-phosphosulfolactate phosphatase [Deinococcus proteolyticus MRP]
MSRRLSVSLLPTLLPPQAAGTALVIDVLRATTTATTFLEHGAAAVMFAPDIATAHAARQSVGENVRLAGERGGVRVEGFDLGNSPLDAAAQDWTGHTVVMNTTNGTGAAHLAARHAERVLLACLRNAPAAAARALESDGDISIICAGTDGQVSLDDCFTAGVLVGEFLRLGEFLPNDSAQMTLALLDRWPDPLAALEASRHGQRLLHLGDTRADLADLARDVAFCAELGVSDCVPELREQVADGLVFR